MQGYYFKPMMQVYGSLVLADSAWLISGMARTTIARAIKHCRKAHGRAEAKKFRDALIWVGVIYPK